MALSVLERTSKESIIKWALEAQANMQDEYLKYDEYYAGDHELMFATEEWKKVFGNEFEDFADNWCGVVADSMAQRLEINGWLDDSGNDKTSVDLAEELWYDEKVDAEEDDLHLQTLIKGDGFLLVWPDSKKGTVDMVFHDALEINVMYDPANKRRIARAAKTYQDYDGTIHLIVYTRDVIKKFRMKKQIDEPLTDEEMRAKTVWADEMLPDGWIKYEEIKNPYDLVPVFHFKNRPAGSTHGMSELKPVIPIQGMLNKLLMDIAVGAEFSGWPQKHISGGGQPAGGWTASPRRVWASTDPLTKFGQFDSMDFNGPRELVEMFVGHIAKVTQTPMHHLRSSGDMPSGEALKSAESGLIHKCDKAKRRWNHPWSDGMSFAIATKRLQDSGTAPTPESLEASMPTGRLIPSWKSSETRHDLEQAQTAQLKSILGIPLEQIWREHFEYSEKQIEGFKAENQVVAAAALAQILSQSGQVAPGSDITLGDTLQGAMGGGEGEVPLNLEGMTIPQILAQLSKTMTSRTSAGEATTNPQANTGPPASPTRRSSGFRD